jgi:uncharacterized membrane protein YhaH (DUF805 family)
MTTEHRPVPVSPFQLKLKSFCIWIETKFECRINRFAFALRMALAAAIFYAIFHVQKNWLSDARWPPWALTWLLFSWAAFWVILQMVRRFHDLGRTGGLFWAVAVPYWVSWRIIELFHIDDKNSGNGWAWILLAALCAWSIWLTLQLFLKSGTEGANGYDGRHI